MRSAFRSKYGLSDVLQIREFPKPVPRDEEVLVRVYNTTVSRTDCHVLWGKPWFMQLYTGLFRPKLTVTGTDFAGVVEAVGKKVTNWKPGDRLIGFEFLGLRSHAEWLVWPANKDIVRIPDGVSYEQAIAGVEGAYYAWNVIQKMNPSRGQKALVNGATGAIGSSVVQLFAHQGVSVTAVCAGEHADLLRFIGAERVIDYKTSDFTKEHELYDFIFDGADTRPFTTCKHLLKEKGMYSSSGASDILRAIFLSFGAGKKVIFAPPKNAKECMAFIMDLMKQGKFKPVIDRKYPLEKIAEAFDYVSAKQKTGNVLLVMQVSEGTT